MSKREGTRQGRQAEVSEVEDLERRLRGRIIPSANGIRETAGVGASTPARASSWSSRAVTPQARAARSNASPSTSVRASRGSPRCPRPPIANAGSGTTSATSRSCPPRARSCCSTGPGTTAAGVEKVMGFCTPQEHSLFLRQTPIFEQMLLEDGILLAQVLVLGVRRRAAAPVQVAAATIRSGSGSSARWTWSRCTGGRTTRGPRTR